MEKKQDEIAEVQPEVLELIAGLKEMADLGGVYAHIQKMKKLVIEIEKATGDLSAQVDNARICDTAAWIETLIDKLTHELERQDAIIGRLHQIIPSYTEEKFKADHKSLEALRSLTSLFQPGGEFHYDKAALPQIKAWCHSYGYSFDKLQTMLGA